MRVDRDRLWGRHHDLCVGVGPRLAGTPADEEAVRYIAAHYRRSGAEVTIQDFPCPSWECHDARLELAGVGGTRLTVYPQHFTEGCDVTAPIAVAASRHELEFLPDLEGKLLVVYGEAGSGLAMDRNIGLLAIEDRRPAALLVIHDDERVPSKLIRDPFLRVAAAAVPRSTGEVLKASAGRTAHLVISARRFDSVSHNVIGRMRGEREGRILIGSHYDTAAFAPGAHDEGSGTAVVMELAEVFGSLPRDRKTIDFVAFGAEEYGRHVRALGSVEYVRRHPEEVRSLEAMIAVDGVGARGCTPAVYLKGWPPGALAGLRSVAARDPRYVVSEDSVGGCDDVPFHLNGVPTVVFMNDYRDIPIHTTSDVPGILDPDELEQAAVVAADMLAHLAEAGRAGAQSTP